MTKCKDQESRLGKALAQLPYLPRAVALVWRAAPGLTVSWLALLVIQGVLPAMTVVLSRALVNGLSAAIGHGLADLWHQTIGTAVALGCLLALQELLHGLSGWVRTAQADRAQDYIADLVHHRSVTVDLAFYDSPQYYDQLHRARAEAAYRPTELLQSLGGLTQNALTLVAMAAILSRYSAWVPVLLLVSTVPAFVAVLGHYESEHRWRETATPLERKAWYFSWMMSTREAAAELRLLGLGNRLRLAYAELRDKLRRERSHLLGWQSLTRTLAGLMALAVTAAVLVWMLRQAALGRVTLGDLVLFYQAFAQGQGLVGSVLEKIGQLYGNGLFLSDLFSFLNLQPAVTDGPVSMPGGLSLTQGICFSDVTFAYPDSTHPALRHLNLELAAGQVTALVGPNGAGKSTVAKLLCRLYDPQEGRVLWDGMDLRDLRLADLRQAITMLFQEPVRYHATVAENIALGENAGLAVPPERIAEAAQAAGAEDLIARLPAGYETLLGKWFAGGVDLSVGEWQRLALARAFLRCAPLLILDEPTSAMDSWAETDWMGRFRDLVAGRTALVITHRFTTAMRADVIYVLEGQRIVESGTHAQLLALHGRYAASWYAQVQATPAEVPA